MESMSSSEADQSHDLEEAKQVFGPNGFGIVIDVDLQSETAKVNPVRSDGYPMTHSFDELEIVDEEECVYYEERGPTETPHR